MFADRDFQEYLKGNLRVDGWKSPWLQETLRRRAEAAKTKTVVERKIVAQKIVARKVKASTGYYASLNEEQRRAMINSAKERKIRLVSEGNCRDCGKTRERAAVQNCDACMKGRYDRQKLTRKKAA